MELAKALFDKLGGNSGLVSATIQPDGSRGIYFTLAPEVAKMPYVVFSVIATNSTPLFDRDKNIHEIPVQVAVFTKDRSEISNSNIRELVIDTLDRQELTYTSYKHMGCIYQGEGPVRKIEDYWSRTISFLIRYQGSGV